MKTNLRLLAFFIFSIFSSLDLHAMDLEKDQEIISLISSDEFNNTLINYSYEGREYPLRIIYNPKKEMLWGSYLYSPTKDTLTMIADVPIPLARHFEDLVLELRGSYEGCDFLLKDETPEEGWDSIRPVRIAESIADPINDEIVQSAFNSGSFVNQVIYYQLENQYYQVRILHNPEEETFSAKKSFQLESDGPFYSFTFSWNKRYAIMVDKRAPQALIDHLSASLVHLSYYDWYFNFSLENGTYVKHRKYAGNVTTIYSLDTFFEYADSF